MTRCQGFVGDKQPPATLVEKSRSLLVARPDVSNIDHAAKVPRDPASPQGKCVILSLRFHDPTDSFISRRILRAINPGDVVTVTRIDRLARSTFDLFAIVKQIVDAGGQFRSLAEPWADTSTSTGRLMIAVLGCECRCDGAAWTFLLPFPLASGHACPGTHSTTRN
jgi:Resolvase, N terminal domain